MCLSKFVVIAVLVELNVQKFGLRGFWGQGIHF